VEVVRDVARRRLRVALAVGGVAAGVLALMVTGAMAEHFSAQFAGGVRYFSATIQVTDDAGGYAGIVSLGKIDLVQRVPGVAAALPSIVVPARPGAASALALGPADTVGYTDSRERAYSKLRTALAAGRQLDPNRQGEVVLGAGMAAELGVRVGDTIDLPVKPRNANPDFVNHPFKVVGVLRRTNTLPDVTASVGLLDAQMLLQESLPASFRDRVDPSSLASGITVYGKPGVDLDALADRISGTVPGVAATRPSEFVRGYDQSARFTAVAVATALLGVSFGGLLVAGTVLMAVVERERWIALKMALGARAWHVGAEHVLEATVIGLGGGVIGVGLGAGLAWLLDLAGRSLGMDVFLVTGRLAEIGLGSAVLLGAGAGVAPALRAARLDPDLALRTR
jgi:putative ABC transport system permease protein